MQTKHQNLFTTIRTEGVILPADLLGRVAEGDKDLEGLRPEDYHLSGEKLNEAINRSWNRLLGSWQAFQTAKAKLPGDDPATSATREKWLLPLFRELDYGRLTAAKAVEIEEKSYAISHFWEHTPIHLLGWGIDLDRRTRGVAGAATTSPHSMVQELLNRSDHYLWAFLSNGRTLRILRDNKSLTRQAFVEFDLEAMMQGEVYPDFKLLWLLCHQSRVEAVGSRESAVEKDEEAATPTPDSRLPTPHTCWLEKWSQSAQQQGTRALDQLRGGVEQAITALGRGFLIHPKNAPLRDKLYSGSLSPQDYYRELLRIVYRLLFLFVAEDRNLLLDPEADEKTRQRYVDYYSTARIRRLAERQRGTRHSDLYHGLVLVMDKLGSDRGCPELALPALGSFLWSPGAIADLVGCHIPNADLLSAVRELAFTVDGHTLRAVDYKNLGAEELGSVYESLLELHPKINQDAGTFELATAAGHERKTTGSYYTPTSLINCLLDSALDPVVDEAAKKPTAKEAEQAILDLKICDPACGSGHFLIAAAHRVGKRLAAVRTGDEEPAPDAVRAAVRDVIGRSIFGVDINPMAVELCKINLWLESLTPGRPLSFLDHHIQCGNSLLGATPALLKKGIPDSAFEPIEGDDKKVSAAMKRQNRDERSGQMTFFMGGDKPWDRMGDLAASVANLEQGDDDTVAGVRSKQERYEKLVNSTGYLFSRFWADTWCAAFVWKKTKEFDYGITEEVFRKIEKNPHDCAPWMREEIERLAKKYQFFHWHLAFPQVFGMSAEDEKPEGARMGWNGGFDVVLGNPPWERVTLKDKEWFQTRDPEIARARTGAERGQRINELQTRDFRLFAEFASAKRVAAGEKALLRNSGLFPLCGVGDVNTFAVFAEKCRSLMRRRIGLVLPTGVVTTDTTRAFVADVVRYQELSSVFDFDNRGGIFPSVQGNVRFCLLTLSCDKSASFRVAAQLQSPHELHDPQRIYSLGSDDVLRINPNTATLPLFVRRRDAELVRTIYHRVRCFEENETPCPHAWAVPMKRMLHMGDDSHLFRTADDLASLGFTRVGATWRNDDEAFLPLMEAKFAYQFDHRADTFDGIPKEKQFGTHPATRELSVSEHLDPNVLIEPRYWVPATEIEQRIPGIRYLFGFRDAVSAVADSRSLIGTILPPNGAGHTLNFFFPKDAEEASFVLAWFNSFGTDYVFRLKATGAHASFFLLRQLPIPGRDVAESQTPWDSKHRASHWIKVRVVELSYTAFDLETFAADCGYKGPPFCWKDERRFIMRCELDAAFFHLCLGPPSEWGTDSPQLREMFSTPRDAVDYIMETFPIVKRKDEKQHGEYRTKQVILEIYDAMQQAIDTGQPYQTLLDPPPGPPTDPAGNFIPMDQWDPNNWPKHIHRPREEAKS